jgi:hypothetical protein
MQELIWRQYGIVCEIYSCSFQDNNGDGVGDLNEILQRLEMILASTTFDWDRKK